MGRSSEALPTRTKGKSGVVSGTAPLFWSLILRRVVFHPAQAAVEGGLGAAQLLCGVGDRPLQPEQPLFIFQGDMKGSEEIR